MSLAQKLIKDFEQLSEDKKKEVIDFVEFLKIKDGKNNFTVNYDTDFYSMGGFCGGVPKVNFSEKSNLSYT